MVKIVESNIPWFISLPRCGSNWIQGMMELYFERPHGPSMEDKPHKAYRFWYPDNTQEKNFMWNHHHDQNHGPCQPSNSPEGDIFLYRNVVDYCYSNCKRDGNDQRIHYFLKEYKRTLAKWLPLAKTIITYENMVVRPEIEFEKIVNHFGQKLDLKKFERVQAIVTKEELIGRRPDNTRDVFYPEMGTETYNVGGRLAFRMRQQERIHQELEAIDLVDDGNFERRRRGHK